MTAMTQAASGGAPAPPESKSVNMPSLVLRLGVLAFIDAITIWLVYQFLDDGVFALAIVIAGVTIWLNIIFLSDKYYPMRWLSPGMALLILMVVYPVFFTVGVSFSNYGTGHLVTKQLAIEQIESRVFVPEDAAVYEWIAFQGPAGDYMLWLTNPETGESFTVRFWRRTGATRGRSRRMNWTAIRIIPMSQIFTHLGPLSGMVFGQPPDNAFRVSQQQMGIAAQYEQQFRL